MAVRADNLHSRLVFWLKILLPLASLVILSTLFLLSRDIRPEDAIPYADVDVEDRLRSPRLTAPDFAGMTEDGAALSLKAAEARLAGQDGDNSGDVLDMVGQLDTPDGIRTELRAHQARLDQENRRMILEGGVVVISSSGYRIETPGLSVALDRTSLESLGKVTAVAPLFTLQAGALALRLADPARGDYVLVFNKGVKMLYVPLRQGIKE